jgi:hypothetical protein
VSRRLLLAASLTLLALAALGPATAAATTCQYQGTSEIVCTNDFSASFVQLEAPAGVVAAVVSVRGGHGEDGKHIGRGGRGGVAEGTLTISPGEALRAYAAESGYGPNEPLGYSSGGSRGVAESAMEIAFGGGVGGGASALTRATASGEIPLLVGGGGGGGGGAGDPFSSSIGGPGGDGAGGDGPGSPQGADGGNPPQQAFPFRELGGIGGAGGANGESGDDSQPPQAGGGAGGGGGGGYSRPGAGGGGGGAPHFFTNPSNPNADLFGAGGGGGGDSYVDPSVDGPSFGVAGGCPSGGGVNSQGQPAAACEGEVTITWLAASTVVSPYAGGEESALVEANFAAPLQVVVANAGRPVAGVPVEFSLPSAGPSGSFLPAGSPAAASAVTNDLGIATAPKMVANGVSGDWTAAASVGGLPAVHFALRNEPVPTATLLDAPASVVAGVGTEFVAKVGAGRSGAVTPSGGVSFFVDGARLCPGEVPGCEPTPLDGAGDASSPSAALAAGSHRIEATYVPSGSFGASQASLPALQVLRGTALVSVSSDPNPSEAGETVRLEADVSPVAPSVAEPQGTVRFSVDGETQAGQIPLAAGKATLELPLPEGTHEISATYSGDALLSGQSAAATQAVGADATAIVLSSSQRPSPFGAPPTFLARLVAHGAPPTGVVSFSVDGAPLCEGVAAVSLDAKSSTASCTPVPLSLPAGPDRVEAAFTPTGSFQPAATTIDQAVIAAVSTTTVAPQPAPLVYGAGYGLGADVEAAAAGLGEPAGSVRFTLGDAPLGAPATLAADGSASIVPSGNPPSAGAHPIAAAYSGDAVFGASRGSGFLVVDPEATVTSLTSAGPVSAGTAVSVAATVAPVGEGAANAAGTVRFLLDGNPVGAPVPLQAGVASSPPLSGLAAGEHDLQAIFSDPAGNFEASRGTVRQLVLPVPPVVPIPVAPIRCSSKLQLTEAVRVGTKSVRLSGLAPLAAAGGRVRLSAGGRSLGSAHVRSDGTFSTRIASTGDAAPSSDTVYTAALGRERSQGVRLDRPLASLGRGIGGPSEARIHLHLDGKPHQRLELSRQTGCGEGWSKLRAVSSDQAGHITLRLPRPAVGKGPAIYRLQVEGANGPVSLPIVVRERLAG